MVRRMLLALGVLSTCSTLGFAAETRTAAPGASRPAVSIHELAWLAGAWRGQGVFGPAREVYSPVTGDAIAGHFIQQKGESIGFYELIVIRPEGASLTYCLKHFDSDLTGWEEKDQVQCFPLVAREGDAFYFDGLTLRRSAPDEMTTAVRVQQGAETRELVFHYRREDVSQSRAP